MHSGEKSCRTGWWALALCLLLVLSQGYSPPIALSQRIVTEGLGKAEKDTLRLDLRVGGKEEKDCDSRLSDQKIGVEEKPLSRELKEKELLRQEEDASTLTRLRLEREAEVKQERLEQEDERIHDKKQAIQLRVP